MAAFDGWAQYYDLIHPGLPGEAEFYVGQAVRRKGRVLELGCGTGRLAIPMVMSGVDVIGLDNSTPMLEECRAKKRAVGKTPGTLKLVHADMVDFDLGRKVDLAIMAYRTFMHLLHPEEQRRCLRAVHRHLNPEGLLILNVWAPKPSLIAPFIGAKPGDFRLGGRHPLGNGKRTLLHYCSSVYDDLRQRISEEHVLHIVDERGTVLNTVTLPMVRAWITAREMDLLARLCGFDVEAMFGDFDCGPFDDDSREMIWVLRPVSPAPIDRTDKSY